MPISVGGRSRLALLTMLAVLLTTALLATTGVRPAAAATGEVVSAGAAAIPGSYIVTLKTPAAPPAAPAGVSSSLRAARELSARSLAGRYGGRAGRVFTNALSGFAADGLTPAEAAGLAADPAVERVYENARSTEMTEQTGAPWSLDRIDQQNPAPDWRYRYDTTGEDVHVYVVDSGIETGNPEFGGRADSVFDAYPGDREACKPHGTTVASAAGAATYGVAKAVRLHSVRVAGCHGGGAVEMLAALDWLAASHQSPAVASFSVLFDGTDESWHVIDDAVQRVIEAGVTVVVAAGNDDRDARWSSPARVADAITVGATDREDRRAGFSNYGKLVDLFAPGTDVPALAPDEPGGWAAVSGTSVSAPLVAGAVARFLQLQPRATPEEVTTALTGDAIEVVSGLPGDTTRRLLHVPAEGAVPSGELVSVDGGVIRGWAQDQSCAEPVTVRLFAARPGQARQQLAEVVADQTGTGPDGRSFRSSHQLQEGTVVSAVAVGKGRDCKPDGRDADLGPPLTVPVLAPEAPPGQADGPVSFVPVGQRAGMRTGLQILNNAAAPADATVRWVGEKGNTAATRDVSLPANGSASLVEQGPAGFSGSVVVEGRNGANRLATTVNHLLGGRTAASSGFTTGARQVDLPLLMRDHHGSTTWFAVQNTGRAEAKVSVEYSYLVPNPDGNGMRSAIEPDLPVPALATRVFEQVNAPGPPSATVFSAKVRATEGVAVTVFEVSDGKLLSYQGIPQEQASRHLAVPLVMANNFGAWTGVQVQNAGDRETTIGLTYGANSATAPDPAMAKGACKDPNGKFFDRVMPGESVTFLQRAGTTAQESNQFTDCTYVGSAWVMSDEPVVAIVNQDSPRGGSAYEAGPLANLTGTAGLPLVQTGNFGITGGVQVANQSLETVTGTLTFGPNQAPPATAPGQLAPCPAPPDPIPFTIERRRTLTVLLPEQAPKAAGCAYVGNTVASSATPGAKLAAVANQLMPDTPEWTDRLLTYTAP